jgi:multiple sugar transport system substrate-binding protein
MMQQMMKLLAGAGLAVAFAGGTMAADLTIAVTPGDNPSGGVRDLAKVFAEMKDVEIELVQAPYDNLFEKAFNAAQTKSGIYDILLFDDTWGPPFYENDFFEPLAPYYQRIKGTDGPDSDFIANAVALTRDPWGTGIIKAIPLIGNAQMFFYHPAEFAKAGLDKAPPFTWDEFLAAAQKIKEEGGGRKFGYVVRGQQGDPVVSNFLPHLWAFGGDFFDKEGNPTLDTPNALQALEFYLKLRDVSPPGVEAFDSDEMATYLLQGAAMSSVNWPNWVADYEDPDSSKLVGEMAYTKLPDGTQVGVAHIGMWLMGMFSASPHKDLAFEFMHWVNLPEQQKYGAIEIGLPPTRYSVMTDPEVNADPKNPHLKVLMENIEFSRPAPRSPKWFDILNSVGLFLSEAVAGVKSPQEALDAAQAALIEIKAEGGAPPAVALQ